MSLAITPLRSIPCSRCPSSPPGSPAAPARLGRPRSRPRAADRAGPHRSEVVGAQQPRHWPHTCAPWVGTLANTPIVAPVDGATARRIEICGVVDPPLVVVLVDVHAGDVGVLQRGELEVGRTGPDRAAAATAATTWSWTSFRYTRPAPAPRCPRASGPAWVWVAWTIDVRRAHPRVAQPRAPRAGSGDPIRQSPRSPFPPGSAAEVALGVDDREGHAPCARW